MSDLRTWMGAFVMPGATALLLAGPAHGDPPQVYEPHVLVSDGSVPADHLDANLVNAWGIALNPTGPAWVANNGTGTSTLYDGAGHALALVVTIPPVNGDDHGNPTGIVFSGGNDFVVSSGGKSGPARFIFDAENGTITAWAPTVDGTHAIVVSDRSDAGAIYKGLAIGGSGAGHLLYAADFHNGRVDVFDSTFARLDMPGAFVDRHLPAGYAPFGIQNVQGDIYVTYARQDADAEDEIAGRGLGIVDVYDPEGALIARVATRGHLDAPWGVALAPASFGRYGGSLLIGNFGDGAINAFDPMSGEFRGTLRDHAGKPLQIDGLWGLAFGNGVQAQPSNVLFFTVGPNDESGGAYGRIDVQGH